MILVKGGDFAEAVGQIHIVGFDKTGMLSAGKPTVAKVVSFAPRGQWWKRLLDGQLDRSVVIAVVTIGVMQVPAYQVINVLAVWDSLVTAVGAVFVVFGVRAAGVVRRALVGIGGVRRKSRGPPAQRQ